MHLILRYILRKRGQLQHSIHNNLTHSILLTSVLLIFVFSLHIALMMVYEGLSVGDATWLTLTTATTVGYGDISATTTQGRLATVLLIYLGGIFILAKVVGDYFDYRLSVRERRNKGQWSWKMKNHIVILNSPSHSGDRYLQRLIKQFRCSDRYADTSIYLLTPQYPQGLPDFITRLTNVVYNHGDPSNPEDLNSVCIEHACDIIVLAKDENDEGSDGRTFDILHRLKDLHVTSNILAECVEDSNRKRLAAAGANILIRPIRAYPEMIVRAFDVPGSEGIIENMFNSDNDTYKRFDVDISNLPWHEVVTRLVKNDMGIAVAYIEKNSKQMVYNPAAHEKPDICALITICKNNKTHNNDDVKKLVS